MGELQSKRFDEPDEVVSVPNLTGQIVVLGEVYVGRCVHQPGFCWSTDVKPLVGTSSCQIHHRVVVLSGYIHMNTDDGGQRTFGPGEAFDMPPGHDGCVVGDEPCVTIEFRGVRDWAKPMRAGERVLATLLFTDIVGSTANAARLGDAAWKELLARHYTRVWLELDRFRGYESKTTGDGFLALFDDTARAVRCAAAFCQAARQDGIEVRAGWGSLWRSGALPRQCPGDSSAYGCPHHGVRGARRGSAVGLNRRAAGRVRLELLQRRQA